MIQSLFQTFRQPNHIYSQPRTASDLVNSRDGLIQAQDVISLQRQISQQKR